MVAQGQGPHSFIPQAGATHSLMEEIPRVNTGMSFLFIVLSLPREAVS